VIKEVLAGLPRCEDDSCTSRQKRSRPKDNH
jgi:hypothetical protein